VRQVLALGAPTKTHARRAMQEVAKRSPGCTVSEQIRELSTFGGTEGMFKKTPRQEERGSATVEMVDFFVLEGTAAARTRESRGRKGNS